MEIQLSIEDSAELPLVAEHQPVEFACPAPDGTRLALALDGQPLEPFLRPGEAIWRWRWNPGPAVGVHRVALSASHPDGGAASREWALRVVTRKLDQERYEALLEDIQRVAYGILYSLAGSSAEGAGLQREPPWRRSPIEEYFVLFEQRLDSFERAVWRIAARPREHLRGAEAYTPLGQAAALGADALARLPRGQFDEAPPGVADELQAALRPGGGLLPRDIAADRATPTLDIYEHRLLKHLLALLLRRARYIGALAEREAARLAAADGAAAGGARRARVQQIVAGSAEATRRLRDMRGLPFLAEVRPLPAFRGPTPLLQRDPAYRELYRMWLALRQPPFVAFDSPLFYLPIADLPRIYEIWCALTVVRGLLALGGAVREQRLVELPRAADDETNLDFTVDLIEQAPLLVIDHGDRELTLRYQPHYRPLTTDHRPPTTGVDPRSSVVVGSLDRHTPLTTDHRPPTTGVDPRSSVVGRRSSVVVGSLDRHTRIPDLAIEVRQPGARPQVLLLDAKYRLDADGRGVPQDALAEAYAYLGAIGCAGARATLGALLLYPGASMPELFPSGVGAVPVVPGHAGELEAVLARYLDLTR